MLGPRGQRSSRDRLRLAARADLQGLDRQCRALRDAGAIVTASAAEAARVAAAVAAGQPALATAGRP